MLSRSGSTGNTSNVTPTKGQPNQTYSLDTNKISALVFLVPLQYLRNFSNYFDVMVDRVPGLVEKLRRLRLITKTVGCFLFVPYWFFACFKHLSGSRGLHV